jgi:hypothetical protein
MGQRILSKTTVCFHVAVRPRTRHWIVPSFIAEGLSDPIAENSESASSRRESAVALSVISARAIALADLRVLIRIGSDSGIALNGLLSGANSWTWSRRLRLRDGFVHGD